MTPLTRSRVDFIRFSLGNKMTQKQIAETLGVHPSYVSRLKRWYIDGKRAAEETA